MHTQQGVLGLDAITEQGSGRERREHGRKLGCSPGLPSVEHWAGLKQWRVPLLDQKRHLAWQLLSRADLKCHGRPAPAVQKVALDPEPLLRTRRARTMDGGGGVTHGEVKVGISHLVPLWT